LTYREAAAALRISERSLWSLVRAGRLPAVRIGAAVRIDPADLAAYIAAAKQPATPAEVRP
jgi:excisionase family DNA binding protein